MSMAVNRAGVASNQTAIEQLKKPTGGNVEAEKARLRKVTKEFESFFLYQMLKTMRQTIPENPLTKGTGMSGGMGKDTFTEMFDMEVARKVTVGGESSIADLLYNSMEKLVDAKYSVVNPNQSLKPLPQPGKRDGIKLDQTAPVHLPGRSGQPIKIEARPDALPIQVAPRKVKHEDPLLSDYQKFIDEAAKETKLDSTLISSVIRAESNGDPDAVSSAGAKGLMQLMDGTAKEVNVKNSLNPEQNIKGGSRYLKKMLERFGSVDLALAAYNAGPGNVDKYGGMPPFEETQKYVKRVGDLIKQASGK